MTNINYLKSIFLINLIKKLIYLQSYPLDQWFSRCTLVHTSVHEFFLRVHRKFSKVKFFFLDNTCLVDFYGKK